ncbi:MAG: fatty acid--CoA ligase family protein [Opitutae bacterium]|nr:fatty acid--CoA ligase family protein [Opitutae bacterium]MDG1301001.1 fatty acid--CoA ligase family protein [Opitutae bacterium]
MGWIDQQFVDFGAKVACYEHGRTWTYADFVAEVDRMETLLSSTRGQAPEVIAIQMDLTIRTLAAVLAIVRLKQIALPLSSEMPIAEQVEQQRIAGATFLLNSEGLRSQSSIASDSELIKQLSARGHAGLILFSSGTSGEPKGMLHDLDALLERYREVRPRGGRTVQLLLADHIGGLDSAFRTLFAGSTLVVPEARTALSVGEVVERYDVNILPASPTFLNLLLLAHVPEQFDCSSLEVIAYGAEPMSPALLGRLVRAFPNAAFQQKFGTSETGAIRIKSQRTDSVYFRIEDSGVEWRVQDAELWLKTSSRILGYLNTDGSSLEADGWYRTGDLVEEAEDGYLRITGRRSQLINVGGQKVHPAEVEQVLSEIEGVDACAVFGKSAPVTGSMVACKIVTASRQDLRTWKRLIRSHCRGRLANWKIPASVELCSELSMTDRLKRG